MRFQQCNLLRDFPWSNESFDVIHLRLVLYHVRKTLDILLITLLIESIQMPNATCFLERVMTLLKPNGWLLIEDACIMNSPRAYGPAQKKYTDITSAFMYTKGLDPQAGATVADFICASYAFDEVNVRQLLLTFMSLPTGALYQRCIHLFACLQTQIPLRVVLRRYCGIQSLT